MKLPFLVNPDGEINFFDLEGQPLGYTVPEEQGLGGENETLDRVSFVKSPMPGTIVKTYVKVGQRVLANEPLISVESMKMEFMVRATHDVTIKEIRVSDGQFV
jgi:acetyl-CoA carboxylase biotin carboxyl carrier protein